MDNFQQETWGQHFYKPGFSEGTEPTEWIYQEGFSQMACILQAGKSYKGHLQVGEAE